MNKGLTKVQIYFWESMGKPFTVDRSKFRMEYAINGQLNYLVGRPGLLVKKLHELENEFDLDIPEPDFQAILGDDNGSTLYNWNNNKEIK